MRAPEDARSDGFDDYYHWIVEPPWAEELVDTGALASDFRERLKAEMDRWYANPNAFYLEYRFCVACRMA